MLDALAQIQFKEGPEPTQPLVLRHMGQLVNGQTAVAPAIRPDENSITESHAGGQWRNQARLLSHAPENRVQRQWNLFNRSKPNSFRMNEAQLFSVFQQGGAQRDSFLEDG